MNCDHRKEESRLVDCPSCRGSVKVKVFQCDKHGECTVGKDIPGLHVCDGNQCVPAPKTSPPVPVRRGSPTTAGSLAKNTEPKDEIALVRLDDGRIVESVNERHIGGRKGKRCVLTTNGEKWIRVQ